MSIVFKKYIYLNKTSYSSIDDLPVFIKNSMEQLLFSELKASFGKIEKYEKYEYFRSEFKSQAFHDISEIEIFQKISHQMELT